MIYLASRSPRRYELLQQIGVSCEVVGGEVDERPNPNERAEAYVLRMALAKARAAVECVAGRAPLPLLGSDTAVVVDGEILGKPVDRAHGMAMLAQLSGRQHRVLTAVALLEGDDRLHEVSRLCFSTVTFCELSVAQCAAYWATGEPLDKAGGYAIQGRGAAFVAHLEGSYSAVMGLPLFETAQLLSEFGVDVNT